MPALSSEDPASLVPSVDDTGHGTFVASLAAGGADISEQFLEPPLNVPLQW